MTIEKFLRSRTQLLNEVGIQSARLDCLLILEDATGRERSWLLAHLDNELPDTVILELDTIITQRSEHIPIAYIRGKSEFYGRIFAVNEHVLVPRPETETMVELLKALPMPPAFSVVDVGTGSGAVAVSVKLEIPQATVMATDIDAACLRLARHNARALGAEVTFYEANMLSLKTAQDRAGSLQSANVIVANLPYVPDDYAINRAARHEPSLALFGGLDGLDMYRLLFEQIDAASLKPSFILTEALPAQHTTLGRLAKAHNYKLRAEQGYIQVFRPTTATGQ